METQHTPGPIAGKTIVVRKDNRIVGFWNPSEFKVRKQTISFYDESDRSIERILEDTEEWFMKKSAPGHEFSIQTIQIQSPLEAAAPELLEALKEAYMVLYAGNSRTIEEAMARAVNPDPFEIKLIEAIKKAEGL